MVDQNGRINCYKFLITKCLDTGYFDITLTAKESDLYCAKTFTRMR